MKNGIQNKLSRLRISYKLTLLLGCFFIPLAILGGMIITSVITQSRFTANQLVGLKLLAPSFELIKNRPWGLSNQDIRSVSNEQLRPLRVATESQISTVTRWASEFHDSPISLSEITGAIEELATITTEEERDEVREKIDYYSLHLIQKIARQSGLILDPEFATYNYIFTSTWLIPKMYRDLREIIHLTDGSDVDASKDRSDQMRKTRATSSTLVPTDIKENIELSVNFTNGESTNASEITEQLSTYITNSNILIQSIDSANDTTWSPEKILISARHTESSLGSLADTIIKEIEARLVARQSSLATQFWSTVTLEVVTLLLLLFLSTAIAKNITTPIYSLLAALKRAATRGDLTVQVNSHGSDELAVMNDSFNQMIESIRRVVADVKTSSRSVGGSAEEIAATSRQQQATVNEVAATVVQIEATSKEISATSQQLAKTVTDVHMVAESTADAAISSQNGLVRMEETMSKIVNECSTIAQRLAALSERATKIGSIVTTISKVADQSNLLSLNAAIEAEKAGDLGRGFTVVASEIRRMADQTAVSSYDIEQTVKEMQSAVSASVMGMERFSDEVRRGVDEVKSVIGELTGIIGQVRDLTPRFESVHEGMGSQALGAQQISEAIAQLSIATQQSAQAVTQSVLCVERLRGASSDLTKGVEQFSDGANDVPVS